MKFKASYILLLSIITPVSASFAADNFANSSDEIQKVILVPKKVEKKDLTKLPPIPIITQKNSLSSFVDEADFLTSYEIEELEQINHIEEEEEEEKVSDLVSYANSQTINFLQSSQIDEQDKVLAKMPLPFENKGNSQQTVQFNSAKGPDFYFNLIALDDRLDAVVLSKAKEITAKYTNISKDNLVTILNEITKSLREEFEMPIGIAVSDYDVTSSNLVQINIYGGKINEVIINNNSKMDTAYLKEKLKDLKKDALITNPLVENTIISLNKENTVLAKVSFEATKKEGYANIIVDVKDLSPYSFGISVDTAGNDNLGNYNLNLFGDIKNLLGRNDTLSYNAKISDEAKINANVEYSGDFFSWTNQTQGISLAYNTYATDNYTNGRTYLGDSLSFNAYNKWNLIEELYQSLDLKLGTSLSHIDDEVFINKNNTHFVNSDYFVPNFSINYEKYLNDNFKLYLKEDLKWGLKLNEEDIYKNFIKSESSFGLTYELSEDSKFNFLNKYSTISNRTSPAFSYQLYKDFSLIKGDFNYGIKWANFTELNYSYTNQNFTIAPYLQNAYGIASHAAHLGKNSFSILATGFKTNYTINNFFINTDVAFKLNAHGAFKDELDDARFLVDFGYLLNGY